MTIEGGELRLRLPLPLFALIRLYRQDHIGQQRIIVGAVIADDILDLIVGGAVAAEDGFAELQAHLVGLMHDAAGAGIGQPALMGIVTGADEDIELGEPAVQQVHHASAAIALSRIMTADRARSAPSASSTSRRLASPK